MLIQIYQEKQSKQTSENCGAAQTAASSTFDKRENAAVQKRLLGAIGRVNQMAKIGNDLERAVKHLFLDAGFDPYEFKTCNPLLFDYISKGTDHKVLVDALKFLKQLYPKAAGFFSDVQLRNGIDFMSQLKSGSSEESQLSFEMKTVLFEQMKADSYAHLTQALGFLKGVEEDKELASEMLMCLRESGYDPRYTEELYVQLKNRAKIDGKTFFSNRESEINKTVNAQIEKINGKYKNRKGNKVLIERRGKITEVEEQAKNDKAVLAEEAGRLITSKNIEFAGYMKMAKFHELALPLLDSANRDTKLALRMLDFINKMPDFTKKFPFFTSFLLSKGLLPKKEVLISIDPTILLFFEPNPELIIPFLESNESSGFLEHLSTSGALRMDVVTFVIQNFDFMKCCFTNESASYLAKLFNQCAPCDVLNMMTQCHLQELDKRPQIVFKCMLKVSDMKIVMNLLSLFKSMNVSYESIEQLFEVENIDWANAVKSVKVFFFTKETKFAVWLNMANALVEDWILFVEVSKQWYRMSGMCMVTNECILRLNTTEGCEWLLYVHHHPNADKPSVGAPNASQIHFKKSPGSNCNREIECYPALSRFVPSVPQHLKIK